MVKNWFKTPEKLIGLPNVGDIYANQQGQKGLLDALQQAEEAWLAYFPDKIDGVAYHFGRARIWDQALSLLCDQILHHDGTDIEELPFCVIATGGYGRRMLAPYSDIDLLFLLKKSDDEKSHQMIKDMLYCLWDSGTKIGYAVRDISQSCQESRSDIATATSLMDSRLIYGERFFYQAYHKALYQELSQIDFISQKLLERDERHKKWGDSRYVLEPNIKENKGGLRDLHTLIWIRHYLLNIKGLQHLERIYSQSQRRKLNKAHTFFTNLRCHLHVMVKRGEDNLTFDLQKSCADRLDYRDQAGSPAVERFMKHYFRHAKHIGDLTRILCAALQEGEYQSLHEGQTLSGFIVTGKRLNVDHLHYFRDQPVEMLRFFSVAQERRRDVHPFALQAINRSISAFSHKTRRDTQVGQLFLKILCSPHDPEKTLRLMSETGLLARILPEFARIEGQMQFDMYHVYTVDAHTIRAIGFLHHLYRGDLQENFPLASRAVGKIISQRALRMAMLLHDIAKGRKSDHSILGARIAKRVGNRLGLPEEEIETISWLVRWHLLMSDTAFRRDIEDDQTLYDFATKIGSLERLRLLLVLTTADIYAVGPGRWTEWKASLIGRLFERAKSFLSDGMETIDRQQRIAHAQKLVAESLSHWPKQHVQDFLDKGYDPYWLAFDTKTHIEHAKLIRDAQENGAPLTVTNRVDTKLDISEVTIYTADHAGLLAKLTGAFALAGVDIAEARLFTMSDGMALDIFKTTDAAQKGPLKSPDQRARLAVIIEDVLIGKNHNFDILRAKPPIMSKRALKSFEVFPRVLFHNQATPNFTLIEINARDRPALLYVLTSTLEKLGLQIFNAKIATYGEVAVDVFYVKDIFGLKITNQQKLAQIQQALLTELNHLDRKLIEATK